MSTVLPSLQYPSRCMSVRYVYLLTRALCLRARNVITIGMIARLRLKRRHSNSSLANICMRYKTRFLFSRMDMASTRLKRRHLSSALSLHKIHMLRHVMSCHAYKTTKSTGVQAISTSQRYGNCYHNYDICSVQHTNTATTATQRTTLTNAYIATTH